jgi:hypothetical protein
MEARGVDAALRVHEPGRGAKARHDAPDAVLEALDGRLCRPVVLGTPPLVGTDPQERRDNAGRERDECDERGTDEHRRPDTVSHRHGDTTEVLRSTDPRGQSARTSKSLPTTEQVDWDALQERVAEAPFGAAFLTLAERLEISPPPVGSRFARPEGRALR